MMMNQPFRNTEPVEGGNGADAFSGSCAPVRGLRGMEAALMRDLSGSMYEFDRAAIIDKYGENLAPQLVALAGSRDLFIEVDTGDIMLLSTEESIQVKTNALRLIGHIRPPANATLPAIMAALDDSAPAVRVQAARTIGEFGAEAHRAVPLLTAALSDSHNQVREAAASALGDIGPTAKAAIPDLFTALDDPSDFVRKNAAGALAAMGADVVPQVAEALRTGNLRTRESAALVFRALGPAAKDGVPELIDALQAPETTVRCGAAWALGAVGEGAAPAVPALLQMAAHGGLPGSSIAVFALKSVGRSGTDNFVHGLNDPDSYIRQVAAEVLAETTAPQAFAALCEAALKDQNSCVRFYAVKALWHQGDPAVSTLTAALGDKERHVREAAAEVLGWMGPRARSAVPELLKMIGSEDLSVTETVTRALGSIGDKSALEPLKAYWRNARPARWSYEVQTAISFLERA